MKRFAKLVILLTAFLIVIISNVDVLNAQPVVAIDLNSTKINVGEEFSIGIVITNENIEGMAGWSGSLLFDSTLLSLQGAKAGSFTIPDTTFLSNQPEPGKLIMIEFGASRTIASGQGTIAEVSFIASQPGNAFIKLSDFAFANPDGNQIFVDIGDNLYVQTICMLPVKPVLTNPANGDTGVFTAPALDWNDVSGATSYKVQVCTDSSCLSIVRNATCTDSEWTVTPALNPVKPPYYWRVKAVNACGSSPWSNIRSFTTVCPTLDVPILRSPSNGTIGVPVTPTLDWDDVSGATSHKVQVCSDISCVYVVASALTTGSQWTVTPALNHTSTYYWRTKAKNSCGSSAWSEVWSFKTKPTITVVSPNGSPPQENWQAGTTQTISWTYTGNPGPYVKIELFKAGIAKSTLKASKAIGTNGSGYYNWTIPVNQKAGCDYQIKITSTTNSIVKDKSDGYFCIYQ
jgi:Cohesin domain/Kre9/KNH-like N-terminal Ig-like domain